MNRFKKTVLTFGVLIGFLIVGFSTANAQGRNVSLQVFYDELSYHGEWINNPDYGYVWRPNVGNDFRPYYTNGRWLMTEYGNTWVSDYSWGWAPFHYGRWFYDDYDGWVWLPDTEWGPAWVDWRTGGGYYGWAPMGPRMSININIGRRYYPDNYWVFIPQRHIYYTGGYYNYWQPNRNVVIIKNTTIINNVYVDRSNRNVRYNSGPRAADIRRATNQNVRVYKVADANRAGTARVSRGTVNVYRPQVERGKDATPRTVAARPTRNETTTTGRSTNTINDRNSSATPSRNNTTESRTREANTNRANVSSRTSTEARGNTIDRSAGQSSTESRRAERGNTVDRNSTNPQRVERTPSSAPQRIERSSSPERVERVAPSTGNNERQSSAPERRQTVERSAPAPQRTQSAPASRPERAERSSSPQRVERSAPAQSSSPARSAERSSGSSNSGRSSGGSSRPSR